ncbi:MULTISPECIES: ABC transporter ATP-binding protein [Anaerococcus]|jgi:ABC transporter related|uniref:Multidrug export ATP-binding/permease protein SAV1866 n=1 Tax=Anaerococcus octavius TaxID=54007 RepID=A0A380WVH2_9FIRM|nr:MULTISPECIES: ABC transporter ATP-binding protein [Anaerococcus]MDU2598402.1 ABC transporter ATP-binding protein [Anaerococcus sp.]MDU3176530.1 ABC transporter ATP-binding protein [Anaerococcus sp.]SUU92833.1 Putative multidrug export ATP-binding/permease protein SAV1866 [Anaerococcus octavius]
MSSLKEFNKAFSYLKQYLNQYSKNRIISMIMTVLETIFELLIPAVMGIILNEVIYQKDSSEALKYGALIIALSLLSMFTGIKASQNAGLTSTGLTDNVRKAQFRRIQVFAFEDFEYFGVPSLLTRLTTDMQSLAQSTFMTTRFVIKTIVMALVSFILAFRTSSKLSIIFLILMPVLVILLLSITSKAIPKFRQTRKQYDKLNLIIEENLNNMRVVKAFVRKKYEMEKFAMANEEMFKLADSSEGAVSYVFPTANAILYAAFVALTWFGGIEIINGRLGVGDLVSFNMYAMMLLGSLIGLSMVITMLMTASPSVTRVKEVLTREISMDNDDKIDGLSLEDGSIDFDNVSFKYEEDTDAYQLKDIDLHIKSGEVIGILGPTGSSKSTLVQLIPRLYDITEGSLKVGGHDIRDYDLQTLRDDVSIVLQKNTLFSGSILENLKWGDPDASFKEVVAMAKLAQADEFVKERNDEYESELGQGGTGVSGGQKQRLTIARSLLKKPKILILDNSTSAVDTKTESKLLEGFSKLDKDMTQIIISQRLSSFDQADRIVVMDNGSIADVGTSEELYQRNEIYRLTYDIQNKGGEDE